MTDREKLKHIDIILRSVLDQMKRNLIPNNFYEDVILAIGNVLNKDSYEDKSAKDAVERTLENNKLQAKIAALEEELAQLREEQLHHCESCGNIIQHDCFTLWFCPALGYVDPLRDGCSRWKEKPDDIQT